MGASAWLRFAGERDARGTVSLDLSKQGAQFSGIRPAEDGTPVLVHLQLASGSPVIECKGRVCWSRLMPNGLHNFGVRFLDLLDDEAALIERFLSGGPRLLPRLAAV